MNNPYLPKAAYIDEIFHETEDEFTIRLKTDLPAKPGQFFMLSLPKIGEAPISVSKFEKGYISFTIRAVGKLTNVLKYLRVNENIFIRGPYGNGFPLDLYKNKNLIIVAGGSGVAPVKPLIEVLLSSELTAKSLDLIVGFKNSKCILFAKQLKQWAKVCNLTLTIDAPEDGWSGTTGLVTEHIRKLDLSEHKDLEVIIVGPAPMMKYSAIEFDLLKVPEDKIWVSFERLMSCGIGKCGHCRIDNTYVCLDGPVFCYAEAKRLID